MDDAPKKFLGFLEQLLPFLTVCPPWLRVWVHVLIVLNFLTIAGLAVAYLASREKTTSEQSLSYFSITSPTDRQQVPLTDSDTWMVTGTLPKTKDADFSVQVFKLPERQSVPQAGEKTKSSFDGQWSFESAKFSGPGTYEIKATASLNGDSFVRSVTVTCYDKTTAYKLSIDREKKFRTGADIVDLPKGAISPDKVKTEAADLQNRFLNAYSAHQPPTADDLQSSLALVNQALDLVDSVLPLAPNDPDLQNARAFFLKSYFQVAQDLHRPEAKQALDEARLMFEAVVEQQPQDTNAWNGLGNVFLLNGQPDKALFFIKRAVELAPENPYAQNDLKYAEQQIEQQKRAASSK
jgi:Tetratricopeptide repeat